MFTHTTCSTLSLVGNKLEALPGGSGVPALRVVGQLEVGRGSSAVFASVSVHADVSAEHALSDCFIEALEWRGRIVAAVQVSKLGRLNSLAAGVLLKEPQSQSRD